MERPRRHQNIKNNKKTVCSQKDLGKMNPRSKKIQNLIEKTTFEEDIILQTNAMKAYQIKNGEHKIIQNVSDLTPLQKVKSEKEKTQKKPPLNQTLPNEGNTVNRNKKLKSIGPKSKRNEYVYIIDPQSQKMKKYIVHQGEDINIQLNNNSEYIPPFQSCDEDCESTEEIVQKGVQYSKKDLINEVERRRKLISLRSFKERESQNSSSTDSRSIGK